MRAAKDLLQYDGMPYAFLPMANVKLEGSGFAEHEADTRNK